MKEKGTILIIDDKIEEKIGKFKDYLDKDGFDIKIAKTFEKADYELSELLKNNTLDGIILDFSFPINEENASVIIENIPAGVFLIKKHEFKITTQRIPVVINTTGDEEYKTKHLGDLSKLNTNVYNVNHQANPLAQPNTEMVREILKMFNERSLQRKMITQAQPDKKWLPKGRTGIYDGKSGKYTYLRDGD